MAGQDEVFGKDWQRTADYLGYNTVHSKVTETVNAIAKE